MSEGLRNARAGGLVSAVVIVVCTWVAAAAGLVAALDTSRIVAAEEQWIAAGGYALVVVPSGLDEDSRTIDAERCDRLATITGVLGSFAVAATGRTLAPNSAPGSAATLFAVTPGVYRFFSLAPPSNGAGVVVPSRAAERSGLADDERTWFVTADVSDPSDADEFAARVRLVSNPILGEDLSGAYLLPDATLDEATACYVLTDAAHVEAVTSLLPGTLASPTSPAVAQQRVAAGTYGVSDFSTAFAERVSRWAWAAAAAVLMLLWALLQRVRRQRLAVYATFGAGPRPRLVLQVAEWGALSVPGCALGAVLAVTGSIGAGADPATSLVQAPLQVAAAWLAATAAVVVVGLIPIGTVLDSLKDRT